MPAMTDHTPRSAERIRELLDAAATPGSMYAALRAAATGEQATAYAANDARKAAFIATLTERELLDPFIAKLAEDPDPLGTTGRARAYISRPELCTRDGLIDWVAGLCDIIEAATADPPEGSPPR